MKHFDMIVIGSGAGLMVAQAAHYNGMTCAIIEQDKFGGTCLTKGCIPSKMLVYPADLIRDIQNSKRMGIYSDNPTFDWKKISERMWSQIDFNIQIEDSLKQLKNFEVYNGTAEFIDKYTIGIRNNKGEYSSKISGDIIVVANGARSFVPPIENIDRTGYITSESFFGKSFPEKPWKSLIIVGGGAIGAEFAHIFSAFGTEVTIVEMQSNIISTEEKEISDFVEKNFKENNIKVLTNKKVVSSNKNLNKKSLTIEDMLTGEKSTIEAEEIFISSGVRSNSDTLNLKNTDIEVDERGWIKTDAYLNTSQDNVYAIGDINGLFQFRHTANYEAEILMHNLFSDGDKKAACYTAVPWAIYTSPQVGHVGMTEQEAKNKGFKYWVGRNYYSQIAGGIALGISDESVDNGFVKLIVGEDRTILGAHIVGPYASMLVQPFVYMMNSKCVCEKQEVKKGMQRVCPPLGSFVAINDSMVIHPSFNELTAWVIENIDWENSN